VVRSNLQQQRRDHGDGLLTRQRAAGVERDNPLVQRLDGAARWRLAQLLAAELHLPSEAVRVPRQRRRRRHTRAILQQQLPRRRSRLQLSRQLAQHARRGGVERVDAEGDGQRAQQRRRERIELVLRHDLLRAVVRLELVRPRRRGEQLVAARPTVVAVSGVTAVIVVLGARALGVVFAVAATAFAPSPAAPTATAAAAATPTTTASTSTASTTASSAAATTPTTLRRVGPSGAPAAPTRSTSPGHGNLLKGADCGKQLGRQACCSLSSHCDPCCLPFSAHHWASRDGLNRDRAMQQNTGGVSRRRIRCSSGLLQSSAQN
jgi:hypothetical protein